MSTSETWAEAAHLVRSVGFGASGALVDAVAAAGPAAWLDAALAAQVAADPGVAATPTPSFEVVPPLGKDASMTDRQKRRQQEKDQISQVVGWWVTRMVTAQNPLVEKLTFGWHNHFATSATKVKSAPMLLAQNQSLRSLGRGSFSDLAQAMIVDPAMLYWLDAQQNTLKAPNENLSREFMELFTLGHGGGYTEQDVREGARSLTGWTISRQNDTASFVAKRHDTQPKTVLGTTANLDAPGFVRVVLDQKASAAFVATRWWQLLVSPDAPTADTLARIVAAYGSSRDLSRMFRAMLTDPTYAATAGSRVASPVEWVVGAMRSLAVPTDDATVKKMTAAMRDLGQLPLYPPNVSGWPSGQAWLSTASATTRVQTANLLAAAGDLHAVADVGPAARVDAVAHLLGIPALSARTSAALTPLTNDPKRLVSAALVCPENLVI
ncbi:DUF1800 domain-containing protein [Lapillicoccus sp.]|uniref:DUF1800 domain-containing protein n=1 Tax=Lapillicoccus sp. TaxID=1909287 RepID=UPI0032650A5E